MDEEGKCIHRALFEVQKELTVVRKASDNPFYKSKYADLVQVMEVANPLLLKNNLLVVHAPEPNGDPGILRLRTEIIHVPSGERISCVLPIPLAKATAQEVGSACQYGRRYNTCCLLNILSQEEDDDGNAVSGVSIPADRGQKAKTKKEKQPDTGMAPSTGDHTLTAAETLAPFVQNIKTEAKLRTYYKSAVSGNKTLTDKDREELDALFAKRAEEIRTGGEEDGGN